MRHDELVVGQLYRAKVAGKVTTVRLDSIREFDPSFGGGLRRTRRRRSYEVTNLRTGRRTSFRSAAKFREATSEAREKVREQLARPAEPYYVHVDGPNSLLVGPFDTVRAAVAHREFCRRRGDTNPRVIPETSANALVVHQRLRPDEDQCPVAGE